MKISAINSCNSVKNNYSKNTLQFKGEHNTTAPSAAAIAKTSPIILLGVAAVITGIKCADKVKNAVGQLIRNHTHKAYITITIPKKDFELDTTKLRRLPAEIKTQAIEALNKATTSEEKNTVIKKFAIAK